MRISLLLLSLVACGADPVPTASVVPIASAAPTTPTGPATARTADNPDVTVRITSTPGELAEDGRGHRAPSQTAVSVEIEAEGWPGRAMEPALYVDDLRFDAYTHTSPTTLRFVVTDPSLLPQGADASVKYGEHEHARFTLPEVR